MKFFRHVFLLIIFFRISSLSAQSEAYKALFEKAESYFNNEQFAQALPLYLELDSMQRKNGNINFKIGICYINSSIDKSKSIAYLEKAVKWTSPDYADGLYKERSAPVIAYYYLAHAYHLNYRFEDAIKTFKMFQFVLKQTDSLYTDVNWQIEMCQNGIDLKSHPVNIKVENLGEDVNSEFGDYSPVLTADESTLIFTSRRDGGTGGKIDENDNEFFEDIYVSQNKDGKWQKPLSIGPPINTDGHEATLSISVDGQKLFIYKDDQGDGNIYCSDLIGDKWSEPQKLNSNINSKSWEPSASISPDGETLYFTSDRPGGYGGRDIYKSKKLPNGQWGRAQNLGPTINTKYDEDAPYIHPDGITLYFSSKGHKTMGGFDIFSSAFSEENNSWSTPKNIGYPANTTDDDIYYVPSADSKRAYYSSFKANGYGEEDIYMMTFLDQKENALTVYSGEIKSIYKDRLEGIKITVTLNATGEVVGYYYPNSTTGKYLFILSPGDNYNIAYENNGFLFHSENLETSGSSTYNIINTTIELPPVEVGQKMVLNNIFFASGKAILKPESKVELESLRDLLRKNTKLIVEIGGHSDSKENNIKLSQQRAQAVVDYLISEGIDKIRLVAVGYGDTKPIAKEKNPDGTENKQGMALNRRFELKILSLGDELHVIEPVQVPEKLKTDN